MTEEVLNKAMELDRKINQCEEALKYQTDGTFHKFPGCEKEPPKTMELPYEVRMEMRGVIDKWKQVYEKELEAL